MQRTDQQRKSIEVLCRLVAEELNEKGETLKTVLEKKSVDVLCTQENIKENILKPIIRALYPYKISTTQLNTIEVDRVYEVLNKWLGENFGIHVPFPNNDL